MKLTKKERLDIGRRIYTGEISRHEAARMYNISSDSARNYMRLFRDENNLPPKNSGIRKNTCNSESGMPKNIKDMTKEELLLELVKAKILIARLKGEHYVKADGAHKQHVSVNLKNSKQ